jgi:hypothetical protein
MKAGFAGRYRALDAGAPPTIGYGQPELARLAVDMLSQIKRRSEYLPQACPDNPDWLMILELFIAAAAGRRMSVSDLCLASGVPSTTALRRVGILEMCGLFQRTAHPRDRRISHVALTQNAYDRVADYLRSLGAGQAEPAAFGAAPRPRSDSNPLR